MQTASPDGAALAYRHVDLRASHGHVLPVVFVLRVLGVPTPMGRLMMDVMESTPRGSVVVGRPVDENPAGRRRGVPRWACAGQ